MFRCLKTSQSFIDISSQAVITLSDRNLYDPDGNGLHIFVNKLSKSNSKTYTQKTWPIHQNSDFNKGWDLHNSLDDLVWPLRNLLSWSRKTYTRWTDTNWKEFESSKKKGHIWLQWSRNCVHLCVIPYSLPKSLIR